MTAQPDLFTSPTSAALSSPPPVAAPVAAPEPPLVRLLRGMGWRTARQLTPLLDLPNTETGRRAVRDIADASQGQVAGGNEGYRLVVEMTEDEYQHALARMRKMGREILQRAAEMEAVRRNGNSKPN